MKRMFREFITSERGDTNIKALLFLIMIALALAYVYYQIAEGGWDTVRKWIKEFFRIVLWK